VRGDDEQWSAELIADLPAWTLVQAHHGVARRFRAAFGEVGLGPTQFGVLASLAADPDLSQGELARRNLVSPQNIGALIEGLAERDLVERAEAPGRGRRRPLRLTDAGRDVLRRVGPAVHAINAPDSLGLTGAEAAELNRLLHKVRRAVVP
jgi:DNA-binding MarR family transcriptional regulator